MSTTHNDATGFCLQVHDELKKLTGQRTVPYVYIRGELVSLPAIFSAVAGYH